MSVPDGLWIAAAVPGTVVVGRGSSEVYRVEAKGSSAVVSCADFPDRLNPGLLEFLRAHYDTFTDQGFAPDSWILIGCGDCGVDSFEPCRHLRDPGHANRTVHRGRCA